MQPVTLQGAHLRRHPRERVLLPRAQLRGQPGGPHHHLQLCHDGGREGDEENQSTKETEQTNEKYFYFSSVYFVTFVLLGKYTLWSLSRGVTTSK